MKYNMTVVKDVYDQNGTRISHSEIASWQVWLPNDKPITSEPAWFILAEKFCKWLEKFTRTSIPGLALDVTIPIVDPFGRELIAVYRLV